MNNGDLNAAKYAKKDEFYTSLEDISKECDLYQSAFHNKVIYCNCDASTSNFIYYFKSHFHDFHLKQLIATNYIPNGNGTLYTFDGNKEVITALTGNGDFRTQECIDLLKQTDIVVTNPPFSLFRDYMQILFDSGKQFIILGNLNAVKYKSILPFILNNKLWLGHSIHSGDREFGVPKDYPLNGLNCRTDDNGNKYIRVKGVRWFTNIPIDIPIKPYIIDNQFNEEVYHKYDDYDAINVDKVKEIPYDYDGLMGVPITVMDKVYQDGFAHLTHNNVDIKYSILEHIAPKMNGHNMYSRLIIKKEL